MRFTLVSLALLVLANSLAPGVHAAPAVDSDRASSLAVRRGLGSLVDNLLGTVTGIVAALLGELGALTPQQAEQLVQKMLLDPPPRLDASTGVPAQTASSDPTSPTPSTLPATTSAITSSSSPDVSSSTPSASLDAPNRMVRQLPDITPSLPIPVPSSMSASVIGKLTSVVSKPGAGQPTSSHPSASPSKA